MTRAATLGSPVPAAPPSHTVSTAYVNSGHKGDAAEELITASKFVSKIDWRAEVDKPGARPRGRGRRRAAVPNA